MVNFLEEEVTTEVIEIGIDFPTLQLGVQHTHIDTHAHTQSDT